VVSDKGLFVVSFVRREKLPPSTPISSRRVFACRAHTALKQDTYKPLTIRIMPPKGSKKRKAKGAADGESTAHEGTVSATRTRSKRARQPSVIVVEEEDDVQQDLSDNSSRDEGYEPVVHEPRTPQRSSAARRRDTVSQRLIASPVSGPGLLRWPQLCERCVQYIGNG
jgi:hypothetical protein